MKLSDYVIETLHKEGINHIFQMIGGAITHLVDSTIDNPELFCITNQHEQASAFAAEGYARVTGNLGVAMATSGPGATNLITGIGSCFFDSVPCLFITGQVNTYEYKFDKPIRQAGFQETDIVKIITPIVKGARLITDANTIKHDLEWAINLAKSGRPGPVLLDIPMNIQRAEVEVALLESYQPIETSTHQLAESQLKDIANALQNAKRPVILVGGGVRASNAADQVKAFVAKTNIPVVASLQGLDVIAHTSTNYCGMIGAYGNRYGNLTLANADLLIILGSRLDTRQTGTKPDTFARAAKIVHIDIDPTELNRVIKVDFPVCSNIKNFLLQFDKIFDYHHYQIDSAWLKQIEKYKRTFPSYPLPHKKENAIDANEFIYQLSKHAANDAIIVPDVGQHQMWAGQSFEIQENQRMLMSGGMGAMGFALPTAIGAAFAYPKRQIIVIAGDGGFQVNIQELETIVRNRLNIKIVVLNNSALGMVRQFQHIYFNGRTEGTVEGYTVPDFVKISKAYGIEAFNISDHDEIANAIDKFLQAQDAMLLEVKLPQDSQVEPKLVVNHPIEDQAPSLPRELLQELMLIPLVAEKSET